MTEREQVLKPLRGRDYRGPETRSYPEPSEAEQADNMSDTLRRAREAGRIIRRRKAERGY